MPEPFYCMRVRLDQEDDERYTSNGDTYSESAVGHQLTSVEAHVAAVCVSDALSCVTFPQPR